MKFILDLEDGDIQCIQRSLKLGDEAYTVKYKNNLRERLTKEFKEQKKHPIYPLFCNPESCRTCKRSRQ